LDGASKDSPVMLGMELGAMELLDGELEGGA